MFPTWSSRMEWAEGREEPLPPPNAPVAPLSPPGWGLSPPIIPLWGGIPALQLPSPEEQSQAPEPSAFQPGRKRLLRAFPGGNKSIQHFVKLWQFLKRIFCLRSRRFVVVCFVRLPPAFLPSSKRRRKAKSKRICHNTSLEQGTTRLKSFLVSETVQG